MAIVRGIEAFDSYTFGIIGSARTYFRAKKAGDHLGATQSAMEVGKGPMDITSFALQGIQKAALYLPISSIDPAIADALKGISAPITQALGGLGIATGFLGVLIEITAIVRIDKTLTSLSYLPSLKSTPADKERWLKKTLDELERLNFHQFLSSLPDYLKNKITEKGDAETFFSTMRKDIISAQNLMEDMRAGVLKKQCVHALNLIGYIFGIAASVALLIGCPLVGLILLFVVGLALTAMSVVLKKGWVENPQEGFNWKLLLPEFMQKKMKVQPLDAHAAGEHKIVSEKIKPHFNNPARPLRDC